MPKNNSPKPSDCLVIVRLLQPILHQLVCVNASSNSDIFLVKLLKYSKIKEGFDISFFPEIPKPNKVIVVFDQNVDFYA